MKNKTYISKYAQLLQSQKGLVWTPAFAYKPSMKASLKAIKNGKILNPNLTFIIEDPRHFTAVQLFWNQYGVKRRLSTGFYMVSSALALCKKIHLFGFWPYGIRLSGENSTYHYYNEVRSRIHDMNLEFKWLLAMHRHGMLQLHIDKCRCNT